MKKIEELLNIDLGRKFDTPKKLNRSGKDIPQQIIEDLENGIFTAEMIEELGKQFPIFHYRTCITIHGNWQDIDRTRIGGYKNVHQNQCRSLEVYYSAIDRDKIKEICHMKAGLKCNFRYMENSTDRVFRWSQTINKANYQAIREQMEPVAKSLVNLPIYGYINLYIAQGLWSNSLNLDIHPLAIKQENVKEFTLSLLGMTAEQYTEARAERDRQAIKEAEELKEANRQREIKQAAMKAAAAEQLTALKPQIQHLEECNDLNKGILVKIITNAYSSTEKPYFLYMRKDGNGSFGRIKVSTAKSEIFGTDNLTWKEGKQRTTADIRLTGWRLATPAGMPAGYTKSKEPGKPSGYLTREQAKAYNTPTMIKERKDLANKLKVLTTINY